MSNQTEGAEPTAGEVRAKPTIEALAIAWVKARLTAEALGRDYDRACYAHTVESCPKCSMRVCEHRETHRAVREAWDAYVAAAGPERDAETELFEASKARLLGAT